MINLNIFLYKFFIKLIFLIPRDYEIQYLYYLHYLNHEKELELFNLKKIIKKKGLAIDVGSNHGLYSYALSKINTISKVYSFEPLPNISKIKYKLFKKIKFHNLALSNKKGFEILKTPIVKNFEYNGLSRIISKNNHFKEKFKKYKLRKIRIKKLDSFNLKNVTFIKIDVEGHELNVLKGAKRFFSQNKPICLIEIDNKNFRDVYTFFKNLKIKYKLIRNKYNGINLSNKNFLFIPRDLNLK